jgi:hypothetical protein
MSQTRKRGIRATDDGLELLKRAKAERDLTYEGIAAKCKPEPLDKKTVQRFFYGREPVELGSAIKIVAVLELKLEDVANLQRSVVAASIDDLEKENRTLKEAITEKDRQIEQLYSQKNVSVSEIKILEVEKADMEMKVKRDEESLKTFKESAEKFEGRMFISKQAAYWLKNHKESLLKESFEFVLIQDEIKQELGVTVDSIEKFKQQFHKDINIYLKLVYHCLDRGSHNLLLKAIMQAKIPLNLNRTAYIEAFKFIKEQSVTKELALGIAEEIASYLDKLIALLPTLA